MIASAQKFNFNLGGIVMLVVFIWIVIGIARRPDADEAIKTGAKTVFSFITGWVMIAVFALIIGLLLVMLFDGHASMDDVENMRH